MRVRFTLIEVVVAVAILALSLSGLLQLLTQSQLRLGNAEDKWSEMHMLTQAAEYLLLAGDDEEQSVPEAFFPYPDYTIECTVEDADNLPEDMNGQTGQLPLKKWTIKLIRIADRAECAQIIIDRFCYEDQDESTN